MMMIDPVGSASTPTSTPMYEESMIQLYTSSVHGQTHALLSSKKTVSHTVTVFSFDTLRKRPWMYVLASTLLGTYQIKICAREHTATQLVAT